MSAANPATGFSTGFNSRYHVLISSKSIGKEPPERRLLPADSFFTNGFKHDRDFIWNPFGNETNADINNCGYNYWKAHLQSKRKFNIFSDDKGQQSSRNG